MTRKMIRKKKTIFKKTLKRILILMTSKMMNKFQNLMKKLKI